MKKECFLCEKWTFLPSFSEMGEQFCHSFDGSKDNSRLIIVSIIKYVVVILLDKRTSGNLIKFRNL